MNKESILYGIIGLLVGVVLTGLVATYAVNNNHDGMMRMMGMHTNSSNSSSMNSGTSMDSMTRALQVKTGDDFDEEFLAGMIVHHQGAIDMANLAKQNAKHDEIKELADDIVAAQTKEINDMQQWQMDWGYKTSNDSMPGMNH